MDNNLHIHKRKRVHEKLEAIPHPNPRIRFLDTLVAIVAVAFPLTTLPQIFKIWFEQKIDGISLEMWILFMVFQTPLIIYSFVHKDRKLQLMYSLWIIMYLLIITGVVYQSYIL